MISNKMYFEFQRKFKTVKMTTYKVITLIFLISLIFYPSVINTITNKAEFSESFIPFSIILIGITSASGYIPFYNLFSMP